MNRLNTIIRKNAKKKSLSSLTNSRKYDRKLIIRYTINKEENLTGYRLRMPSGKRYTALALVTELKFASPDFQALRTNMYKFHFG